LVWKGKAAQKRFRAVGAAPAAEVVADDDDDGNTVHDQQDHRNMAMLPRWYSSILF
jgi:hypothetical protein